MISRLLPKPSQIRLLYNLSSKSQSSSFLTRHFSSDQNDNRNSSSNKHSDSNSWKLSDEKFDSFFNSDSNIDSLSGITDAPGVEHESWLAEEKSGGSAGGSAGGGNEWLNSDSFKTWSLDEAESEKKTVFDIGEIAADNISSETVTESSGIANLEDEKSEQQLLEEEEKQLTAILKGPNRAFGDLIAASGITDAMLDSLIALRDFDGVEGLPSLSEIEDIRYEKNTKKSTRAEIERQKQEEVANARVRQVDDKGRAYGTGRRKCSVARVWIEPGDGKFVINDKEFDVYFPMLDHRAALLRPFSETKTLGLWDIKCTVQGGGTTGQVGAIQLGISRAMQNWEPDLRAPLRNVGFLTRDPRAVERKKPGKAKARKSFQWVKR